MKFLKDNILNLEPHPSKVSNTYFVLSFVLQQVSVIEQHRRVWRQEDLGGFWFLSFAMWL